MSVYARRNYDDGQVLFNRILFAFTIIIKLALKLIIYSPLLFISWLITKQMLDVNTNVILSVALILLFATLIYFTVYFFKGVLIALKFNHRLVWILLFIILVTATCILPVWIIFSPLQNFIAHYSSSNQQLLTWFFAFAFGLYVYSRYHFLTNIAPSAAYPYYQMGINSAVHSLNLADTFKAKKSQEAI